MPWATSGDYATEFDPTTDMVLQTIQHMGVEDSAIEADQQFLVDLFMVIGESPPGQSDKEWMSVMDCAFIGLLYHRHMPFKNEDEDGMVDAMGGDRYSETLQAVLGALAHQFHVPRAVLTRTVNDGASLAMSGLRKPEDFSSEGLTLHTHMVMLCILGMLVHRHMPHTHTPPNQQ